MVRSHLRLALGWLRNALAVWAAVLLVAIVALMEPYFTHGLAIGYGPVGAFRWRVVPSVGYSPGFWNHVAAFGLTLVATVVVEAVRRFSGPADDRRNRTD